MKKLTISTSVIIAIIISVATTTIMLNNKEPDKDPRLSPTTSRTISNQETVATKMYVNIDNKKLEVDLENNPTVSALANMLPLTLSMSDLNGNEKFAYLNESLPTNPYTPKHIETGDVMLFNDNCLVIFYKSFDTNYSYSKIGHINDLPELNNEDISVILDRE
ncbi:hypothetical protein IKF15_01450 [Candidatus Saccharibacteria bacterium]|nr:hypothetical protein [Candidatus Saccharibacteria bacterium]